MQCRNVKRMPEKDNKVTGREAVCPVKCEREHIFGDSLYNVHLPQNQIIFKFETRTNPR